MDYLVRMFHGGIVNENGEFENMTHVTSQIFFGMLMFAKM
jgi:hypothetical protein